MCKFSYRYLQLLMANEIKRKEPIPFYPVVGQSYFFRNKWRPIPAEFCRSKVVFRKKEVVEWYNSNYERQI